jgi:3-oxoacyl-(acyl-carrier-protein) synthase
MFATAQNYNDCPQEASKPLSMHAAGFVPSAGAGAFVLESLDSALSRGAYIYCEVLGGHLNSGGQRNKGSMTLGNKEGMVRCIRAAVQESGIQPNDIGLISGHLTSTIGDVAEIESWYEALELGKNNIPYINSLKSMIGHSLSASGSIEIIATVLQLIKGFIHPSLNAFPLHSEIAKYIEEKHVPQVAIDAPELKVAAKISLGFGDVNGCAILKKWEGGE